MARVTYQAMLGDPPPAAESAGARGPRYVPLGESAIATRRKDAKATITITVSKAQRRWLREVAEVTGGEVDQDAIVRALLDLGRELPVDWPLVAGGRALRTAVRESVRVRAGDAAGGGAGA